MTIDIDAIRRREQAATDGPWWAWNRGVGYVIAIGTPSDVDEYDRPQRELPEGMRTDIGRESDAEFIAHARTDIPALLAELDRVRADLAAAHNHAHRQDTNLQQIARANTELANERDAYAVEMETLRAELAETREHLVLDRQAVITLREREQRALRIAALTAEQEAANAQIIVDTRAERDALMPVVEAAKAWRWSGETADGHRRAEAGLMAAVDALAEAGVA